MIPASHLRIGNWVDPGTGEEPMQITKRSFFSESFTAMEPVPIKPEYLGMHGFELKLYNISIRHFCIDCTPADYKYKYKLFFDFGLYIDSPRDRVDRQGWQPQHKNGVCQDFDLQSMHELQNFYFAITKKELNIK